MSIRWDRVFHQQRKMLPAAEVVHYGGQSTAQVKAESLVRLWTSRRRLYLRYHTPALNAVLNPLVRLAMRQRIRALNGEFRIHGRHGQGTTIDVTIPLPPSDTDADDDEDRDEAPDATKAEVRSTPA